MTLARELKEASDVLKAWIWHVPVSLVCILTASMMGYRIPWIVYAVMLGGLFLSYFVKRFSAPKFHDIPDLISKFENDTELSCLNAGQKLLNYISDPKDGVQHQYIAVRSHLGEALKKRIVSKVEDISVMAIVIAGVCAKHPKNIAPLAQEEVVARCLYLLKNRQSPRILSAACHTVTIFCQDERCRQELSEDNDTLQSISKLIGNPDFTVAQEACEFGASILFLSPIHKKKSFTFEYQKDLIKILIRLLSEVKEKELILSVCSLLSTLTRPSERKIVEADYFEELVDEIIKHSGINKLCDILSMIDYSPQILYQISLILGNIFQYSETSKKIAKENNVISSLKRITKIEDAIISRSANKVISYLEN